MPHAPCATHVPLQAAVEQLVFWEQNFVTRKHLNTVLITNLYCMSSRGGPEEAYLVCTKE